MKSVFCEISSDDVPNKYTVDYNVSVPAVGPNSVLIKVKACSLAIISNKIVKSLTKHSGSTGTRFPIGQDVSGVVKQVGADVTTVCKGDEVVGIVPLDASLSGCADYVVLDEFEVVRKPARLSFVDAAGCVGDALRAYTALHYLGRMRPGDTVLVEDGATSFGSVAVQLALAWGAKVLATAGSDDERLYLKGLRPELAMIIDTTCSDSVVKGLALEETGGLGADIIVDNGDVSSHEGGDNCRLSVHDYISLLAVGGRWVTSCSNLQLDPPHTHLLYMKCASVGFLFEHAWTLSNYQQGRYQHILLDIIEKVTEGTIRPNIHHTIPFEAVPEAMENLTNTKVGKIVATV